MHLLKGVLAYGAIGILIECLFTGTASLLARNWRATCQSYLYMWPIYGLAGILFEWIHDSFHWHWLILAAIYTCLIYAIEFMSGWSLEKLVGRCPWHYGVGRYTPMGLINLKYVGYWFGLSCVFVPISRFLKVVITAGFNAILQ